MMHKIIFTFFISLLLSKAFATQTIYIYAGPGVSIYCLRQTESTFHLLLSPEYQIKRILPKEIIHEDWEKETALLVIPGGADIAYMKALNGPGNLKIRSYVENGGAFLGICAGSYYGGNFVEFAKGTDLEVLGERELSFFPGTVHGPLLAPYDYQSQSSARAAKILWKESPEDLNCFVYYNGGGCFVDAYQKNNTTVLACYDTMEEEAAIIECQVGSGKAILSGVHFEYDPNLLNAQNVYLKQIIPILKSEDSKRIKLIKHLLERLNLNCEYVIPL